MKKLILCFLLTTFCLYIAGCSNNITTPGDTSKTSTPANCKYINKAWYKKPTNCNNR
ncbi:hypothetical protein BCN_1135 [Bacillus cereus NC7401]|nr:hypothetical protein BCN_1135 [Bacillus cereus NC7401]